MSVPVLKTERLVLCAPDKRHFEAAAAMWGATATARYTGGQSRDRQSTWFTLCRMRGMWDILGYSYWVIEDRETGAYLGEAGFSDFMRGMTPDLSEWPEAGWALVESAWGKGIATEAVQAAHDWLDTSRSGQTVCIIEPENIASVRVAEKCGYELWLTSEYKGAAVNVYRRHVGALTRL